MNTDRLFLSSLMVNCISKRDTTFEIFIKRYQKYVFSAAIKISRKNYFYPL